MRSANLFDSRAADTRYQANTARQGGTLPYFVFRMMHMATRTCVEVTTRQQSLQILKNTVSLGVSSVLYLRNIFDEAAFSSIWFEGLKLVQLRPTDKKSAFIVSLLRNGVNDALQKVRPLCRCGSNVRGVMASRSA